MSEEEIHKLIHLYNVADEAYEAHQRSDCEDCAKGDYCPTSSDLAGEYLDALSTYRSAVFEKSRTQ